MADTHTRSPIIATLGHVDHGKTTLLDALRGSSVAKREAGGITQMIGASYLSQEDLKEVSKKVSDRTKFELKIPGLLFIDTPGHAAFTNLRERGGSIADLAILVIDVTNGIQPQTEESIRILRQYKTPFIIAANKIDAIHGWKSQKTESFFESLEKQQEGVKNKLDEKLYEIVGRLSEIGMESERFDRVPDFRTQVGIVPVSAKTREGIGELIMLIAGLSQKFLENDLKFEVSGRAKGSIIEVKEERGLGTTIDVIVYDGVLRKGDEIMFLTADGAKTTKVRALLEPNISMNNPNEKYTYVDEVVAAGGVKIFAPGLEDAIPGSPFTATNSENIEADKKELEEKMKQILVERNENGVIVRADSLGSVEALVKLLEEEKIPVKDAKVGRVTRKDVLEAQAVVREDRYLGVILAFNVETLPEAKEESEKDGIPILWSNIIYSLIDRYKEWVAEEKEKEKKLALEKFPWPGKIKILSGCCFRICKPAVFGIEVLGGRIKSGFRLMNRNGDIVGEIKTIQHEKESLIEAKSGMQVAISCDDIYFGKTVCEGDVLYVFMTSDELKIWGERLEMLSKEDIPVINEIEGIHNKDSPFATFHTKEQVEE
ncbi:MAG: translation initiation factor IF-2 [Candidatus Micrarchaeota archaeon]